ncbi:MAG: ABC transporter ATP-binding protein, partial [Lachnospiraceae bacterium]|nr:ABC transporter ATP-binding protein [Lachnospiraceae bacterium]
EIPEKNTFPKPSVYDVVYDHVTFFYTEDNEAAALQSVSFTAPQGKITAIVGPSGGGKAPLPACFPVFMM